MAKRKHCRTDVTDEQWNFVAPYLTLMDQQAPQRQYDLCELFDALHWIARAGVPWHLLPGDFPPWQTVYQQARRWLQASCFEAMVNDLRSIIRAAQGRQGQLSAAILDGRTLQSICESGTRAGYDGYKRGNGSKVHMAVDALGYLLAVQPTPANEHKRVQAAQLCRAVQQATGRSIKLAWTNRQST